MPLDDVQRSWQAASASDSFWPKRFNCPSGGIAKHVGVTTDAHHGLPGGAGLASFPPRHCTPSVAMMSYEPVGYWQWSIFSYTFMTPGGR